MKKILLLFLAFGGFSSYAQRTCATDELRAEMIANDPEFAAHYQEIKAFLHNPANRMERLNNAASPTVVLTIPVVFHVLYKNASQNISDAQINSQLAILNADYRKLNSDFNTVVPDLFEGVAGDMEIVFCKASISPTGESTTGITRKSVPSTFNFGNSYYTAAGEPAWDPDTYLNIWVGRFSSSSLLGFAYGPENAGNANDGLCIGDQFFGNVGTATAPFNKGRTATHEIGHYFGLDHIWGNGDCDEGDSVDDTPPTTGPYYGCPDFPTFENTCDGSESMTMNYMDYTDDACMAMFTADQKVIMQAALAGPRASLLNSNGCGSLGLDDAQAIAAIAVYPNPVSQYFMITSPHTGIDRVEIFNTNGQLVKTQKLTDLNNKIYIEELESGVYYLRIYNQGEFLKSDKVIKK